MKFTAIQWMGSLVGGACLAITTTLSAVAEPNDPVVVYGELPDVFRSALNQDSDDHVEDISYLGQLNNIFGFKGGKFFEFGAFSENEILLDTERVRQLYYDALYQQNELDPYIRTVDLANPFNTSIRRLPSSQLGTRVVGSELVFERPPLR